MVVKQNHETIKQVKKLNWTKAVSFINFLMFFLTSCVPLVNNVAELKKEVSTQSNKAKTIALDSITLKASTAVEQMVTKSSTTRASFVKNQLVGITEKANIAKNQIVPYVSKFNMETPSPALFSQMQRFINTGAGRTLTVLEQELTMLYSKIINTPNTEIIAMDVNVKNALNDGRTVRIPFYTREKIGDSYIYHYEIVNSSPDFYNDQVFLNQIDNLSKLAVQESDNSFFNNLEKIENTNGQRDSIAEEIQGVAQDIDPDTGLTIPRTNATFVRVWLNSTYYNQTVDPSVVDQNVTQTKKEVFDLAKEDIAIKNYASKPETKEPIDKYPCTPSDFSVIRGSISDDVLKCRLKNTFNSITKTIVPRPLDEIIKLANNHDDINAIRLETETYNISQKKNGERTFGFLKVYDYQNKSFLEIIKGVNSNTTFPSGSGFAPPITDPRAFLPLVIIPPQNSGQPDPTNDVEVRMFEYLAKIYPKENPKIDDVEVDEFTDRATCNSCTNVINGVEEIKPYIHIKKPLFIGIYLSGENIPTPRSKTYYSNLVG